jgi:hypothetical protein
MKHKHAFQTVKDLENQLGKARILKCTTCQKEFFALCDELGTIKFVREYKPSELSKIRRF